ncbi:MAG: methyltransferase domain-containing protein [Desulfobacteraceae bacterium]|nr:methyltransferase domain-containing protein [Desulfobacteraceae bacterium]
MCDAIPSSDDRPDIERELRKQFSVGRKEISSALKLLLAENELKYTSPDGHSFIEVSRDKAIRVTDRIVLKPPDISFDSHTDDVVIDLAFGASFGSGSHPTTRLALAGIEYALYEKNLLTDHVQSSALDIGTGSGVLAIAAVKMGIAHAVGIDIDPCARAEASENVKLNGLSDKIIIEDRNIDTISRKFSMILANLRLPTLKYMFPKISQLIEPGGIIVISGIYTHEVSDSDMLYANRFVREWKNDATGWTALIYRA